MTSFIRNIFRAGVVLGAFCFAGVAQAATADGTQGATSTGTTDVTVTVGNRAQITKLNTIALGTFDGVNAMTGTDEMCVYTTSGNYDITLSSANPTAGNVFQVKSGTDFIAYVVKFDDDADASDATPVLSGVTVTPLVGDSTDAGCSGGINAELEVSITAANLLAAANGSYLDTVTLVVTPI